MIGRWGAMIPESEGVIVRFKNNNVDIIFEDGSKHYCQLDDLRNDYYNPTGSPIGIYLRKPLTRG